MGTNYDARLQACPHPCEHCTRPDVHICKSLTSFRGYPKGIEGGDPIVTWRDWKDFLRGDCEAVIDEYGKRYTISEFVDLVERTDPTVRRRQYEWMAEHLPYSGDTWLDIQGFSFSSREFS